MKKPRVVIVGCGFGGLYVAKHLRRLVKQERLELVLINRTNYFLFTPLLHEVATGGLSPTSVTEPLREVFSSAKIRICQGDVTSIDTARRTLCVDGVCNLTYDYLVVATGAETNYYHTPGAQEYTVGLKSLADASRIRDRVIDAFEQAALTTDHHLHRTLLSFIVVGGGATGVELAGDLSEFVNQMKHRYHRGHKDWRHEEASVTLISMSPDLLPMFPEPLRRLAKRRLEKMGIKLHLSTTVTAVTPTTVEIKDAPALPTGLTLWTAGITPTAPQFITKQLAQEGGRLLVDEQLRAIGDERLFVLGDLAKTTSPQLAQAAVSQAKTVAHNLVATLTGKPLKKYTFHAKGYLVSIGQWFAIGNLFGLTLSGRLTWSLWRAVYLFKFASWRKRIRIAFEWTINLFYPRDITKLS